MTAPAEPWLTRHADGVRLSVRVTPRASKSGVRGVETDAAGQAYLAVRVTAPPDGGKANAATIQLLAKRWRLPAGSFRLITGASARRKVLHVAGPPETLLTKLGTIEQTDQPRDSGDQA